MHHIPECVLDIALATIIGLLLTLAALSYFDVWTQ